MNKTTVALSNEQYVEIIQTIQNGFMCEDGHKVKPNKRIATALILEANLGLRISDILSLRLSSTTQRYIGLQRKEVEEALQKHIILF